MAEQTEIEVESILQRKIADIAVTDLQALKDSIPLQKKWVENETVVSGAIRKSFNTENELRLYVCLISHTTHADCLPVTEDEHWQLIEFPNE